MSMDGTPIIIKKVKAHGHAHHGGSWKVAYADFVTAMMAFFMVMWIMGLSDQTKSQISGYFNDPLGFSKTPPMSKSIADFKGHQSAKPGDSREKGNQQLAEDGKIQAVAEALEKELGLDGGKKTDSGAIDISIGAEGLRIELVEDPASVFFASGSAEIMPKGKRIIRERIAPILAKSKRMIIFEGHTDAKPYDSSTYDNWDLSNDRALSVKREMVADHVARKQVMQVRGMADRKLKYPGRPFDPHNRRVVILLPFHEIADEKMDITKGDLKTDIKDQLKPDTHVQPDPPQIAPEEK